MLYCKRCNAIVPQGILQCPTCGLSDNPPLCIRCGVILDFRYKQCTNCGHPLNTSTLQHQVNTNNESHAISSTASYIDPQSEYAIQYNTHAQKPINTHYKATYKQKSRMKKIVSISAALVLMLLGAVIIPKLISTSNSRYHPDNYDSNTTQTSNTNGIQTDLDQSNYEQKIIEALYKASALSGMEQLVAMGVVNDISIGEVLDDMFQSPRVSIENNGSYASVHISGYYRPEPTSSAFPSSGTVTIYVYSDGRCSIDGNNMMPTVITGYGLSLVGYY